MTRWHLRGKRVGTGGMAGNVGEVQIIGQRSGGELALYRRDRRRYQARQSGEGFGISIRKLCEVDMRAVILVDGVNVISGENAFAEQSGCVIVAGQSIEVKGWCKALNRFAAFYFTAHRDAYASRTGRLENAWVIGVELCKRRDAQLDVDTPGQMVTERSAHEPAARTRDSAASAYKSDQSRLGSDHGRSLTSHALYVIFKRCSLTANEQVTIDCDSCASLIERGTGPTNHRQSRPFPAKLVPDRPGR